MSAFGIITHCYSWGLVRTHGAWNKTGSQSVCLWPVGGPPKGAHFCGRGEHCLTHSCPPAKKEQRTALRGVWPAGLHPGWVQRWAAPPHEDLQRCLGARPGRPGGRAPTGPFESVPFMNVILFIRFSRFDLCGMKEDQNLHRHIDVLTTDALLILGAVLGELRRQWQVTSDVPGRSTLGTALLPGGGGLYALLCLACGPLSEVLPYDFL